MSVRIRVMWLWGVAAVAGCAAFHLGVPLEKLGQSLGMREGEVLRRLGPADREQTYPMSRAEGEFRVELQNTYPKSNPENGSVVIREMWWRNGDYWVTLWFHRVGGEWVVLDSLRWRKDLVF